MTGALACAALVTACGAGSPGADSDGAPFATRDSAGIEIVESGAPSWSGGVGWSVDPEPVVEIGALDGEAPYLFRTIADASRLADGRIVVVEGGSREIRIFDASGRHVTSFGGEGEGPGEFQAVPDVLVLPGDTLLALDMDAFRYAWFTPDGELLRDATLPRESIQGNLDHVFSIERELFSGDGSFLHVGMFAPSNTEMREIAGFLMYTPVPDEIARRDIRLGLVFGRGEREIVFGRFPRSESGYVEGTRPRSAMRVTNRFHPAVQYAVEADPVRVHITTPGRREVRTFDADGRLIRILRQRLPLEPLDDDLVEAFRDEVRDAAEKAENVPPGKVMALFDQIEFADSVFPYSQLVADRLGRLWVLEHTGHGESGTDDVATRRFHVFDPRGAWLGRVSLPAGVGTVEEIGENHILSIWTDEFDVPYVRVHRLVRNASG